MCFAVLLLTCIWFTCGKAVIRKTEEKSFSVEDAWGVIKINTRNKKKTRMRWNPIKVKCEKEIFWKSFCLANNFQAESKTRWKVKRFPQRFISERKFSIASCRYRWLNKKFLLQVLSPYASLAVLLVFRRQLTGKSNKRKTRKVLVMSALTLLGIERVSKVDKEKIK